MPIFSQQNIICCICGKKHTTNFNMCIGKGMVCSWGCLRELKWRQILSIMGEKYYENPRKEEQAKKDKENYGEE